MISRNELLKIAIAHVEAGARRLYRGAIPKLRIDYQTDLIGLFIPASAYYSTDKIESMTTYQMRDAGVFGSDDLKFIHEIDKVSILDDDKWMKALEEKLYENDFESDEMNETSDSYIVPENLNVYIVRLINSKENKIKGVRLSYPSARDLAWTIQGDLGGSFDDWPDEITNGQARVQELRPSLLDGSFPYAYSDDEKETSIYIEEHVLLS